MAKQKNRKKRVLDLLDILVETKDGRTITVDKLLIEFANEFGELSKRDERFLSKIVISHLMIEHYIIEFLQETNPAIGDLKNADLEFLQLLSLIKPDHPTLSICLEGIRCINTVRNKCAHDLNYSPQLSAFKPLTKCLNTLKATFDKESMLDIIKVFTGNCCGRLYVANKVIGPT